MGNRELPIRRLGRITTTMAERELYDGQPYAIQTDVSLTTLRKITCLREGKEVPCI
jgi:hypothetical protein